MQESTIYQTLEAMIDKDWLVKSLPELEELLKQFVQDGKITTAEYRSLLEKYLGKFNKTH